MVLRSVLSGGMLVGLSLVLLVTGCAKKRPVMPQGSEAEMRSTSQTAEDLAREELARRQAIEERERQARMESMRGGDAMQADQERTMQQEFVNQDVHFAYDSFTLDEQAKAILAQKAAWMKSNPAARVQIEGHCDERGTSAYNLALGERRANAAKRFVTALGVDAARLSTISYGEEAPLDPGRNEAAWARNRRAHFLITSQ